MTSKPIQIPALARDMLDGWAISASVSAAAWRAAALLRRQWRPRASLTPRSPHPVCHEETHHAFQSNDRADGREGRSDRLSRAARALGTADPFAPSRDLFMRTFQYPADDPCYADNALLPMAVPFEPSFSETQPGKLRFTIEPLPPQASVDRPARRIDPRDAAAGRRRAWVAMRSTGSTRASEPFRGFANGGGKLDYGAFFGSSYDRDGLYASKVYYELPGGRGAIDNLPAGLHRIVQAALQLMPGLRPLFTTLAAQRDMGGQRLTFACTQPLRLADLQPVLDALGLGHRLPGIMQMLGLVLGGRFELPATARCSRSARGRTGPISRSTCCCPRSPTCRPASSAC